MELLYSGKVRDLYADGDDLIMVASDRVSVYDVVLPTPIPDKGRVLTQLSLWWFSQLSDVIGNHVISGRTFRGNGPGGRSGAAGCGCCRWSASPAATWPASAWRRLPGSRHDLRRAAAARPRRGLPAARARVHAHDEGRRGPRRADDPAASWRRSRRPGGGRPAAGHAGGVPARRRSWPRRAASSSPTPSWSSAWLADGTLTLADEVLTPDSSRFWLAAEWRPGRPQRSLDKQFLRDWSSSLDWDRRPPGPAIPPDIVAATQARYLELYSRLTGGDLG